MIERAPLTIGLNRRISQRLILDDATSIELRADNVHRNDNGPRATISLWFPGDSPETDEFIVSDLFSIDRSEDRGRLSTRAWGRLGIEDQSAIGSVEDMASLVDTFCVAVWPAFMGTHAMRLVTTGDEDDEPLEMLCPWVTRGGGTIWFAPPGRGKTFVGMLVTVAIDAGVSTLWPVRQAKAAYVNLERSERSIRRRLRMVNRVLGLPAERPLLMLNARGWSLTDVEDAITAGVERHGVEFGMLDSISRGGLNLNDNAEANTIMDVLNRRLPTWGALAHSPRADETHVFGSQMFDAAADVEVMLTTERKHEGLLTGIGLSVTKANDIPTGGLDIVELRFDPVLGLTQANRGTPQDWPELVGAKKRSLYEDVRDYLEGIAPEAASVADVVKEIGGNRSSISTLLNNHSGFQRVGKAFTVVRFSP